MTKDGRGDATWQTPTDAALPRGGDAATHPLDVSAETRPSIAGEPTARPRVTFKEALRFWVKLGFISFGGPAGQIAIMHRELVERRRWISEERFLHALNYCMLLPGPEAQQLAIYIGWLMHRTWGGIVAGAFFVIPSIFVLLGLSYIYAAYGDVPLVSGALSGFKPVVVAIVVEAVIKIGKRALKSRVHLLIALAAFVAIYFLHVPFPVIVLAAGLVGLLLLRAGGQATADDKRLAESNTGSEPAHPTVIADDAPPPAHTLPTRWRALRTLALGVLLWSAPFVALVAWRGFESLHAREYLFFTKAALVTFGGAYAVLAYVTQAVTVAPYEWITRAQAVDGLALAETTPGPLIMVLQFVGFMAGWNNAQGMTQASSAVLGALVTTYTTFLPCFLFIFIGAPYIEVLRGNRRLTAALGGITAAVVGVILNLSLVFGAAVIWPQGFSAGTDIFAALLSVAAFLALYHLKADVLWVVLTGGAIGLARRLLLG
ncbi:MAG TPA: chromate efflux transporter [Pyrinomonadaceae bacterium]|nr:chromate efflux transporter [Pyrinomonadaceae bacterium]